MQIINISHVNLKVFRQFPSEQLDKLGHESRYDDNHKLAQIVAEVHTGKDHRPIYQWDISNENVSIHWELNQILSVAGGIDDIVNNAGNQYDQSYYNIIRIEQLRLAFTYSTPVNPDDINNILNKTERDLVTYLGRPFRHPQRNIDSSPSGLLRLAPSSSSESSSQLKGSSLDKGEIADRA